MNFLQFLQSNRHILKLFLCTGHVSSSLQLYCPKKCSLIWTAHFYKLRPSLEPQLSGDRAGYCLLVRQKHWSVDWFLYGNLLPTCPQSWRFPLLAHPRSSELCLPCCAHPVQVECLSPQPGAPSAGLSAVPVRNRTVLLPVPAPPTPQNPLQLWHWSHLAGTLWQTTGLAHCDQHICTGQGTPGTICQEMAREHHPASATGTWRAGEPKALPRDSHWGQLAARHPKSTVHKVGMSPWAGQCLHCVSPAYFLDLHIWGETQASSQEKGQLLSAQPSPCPGNPHLEKRSQTPLMCQHLITAGVQFKSFPFCHVFCFQKHTLRKNPKNNSTGFLPLKNNNHTAALLL